MRAGAYVSRCSKLAATLAGMALAPAASVALVAGPDIPVLLGLAAIIIQRRAANLHDPHLIDVEVDFGTVAIDSVAPSDLRPKPRHVACLKSVDFIQVETHGHAHIQSHFSLNRVIFFIVRGFFLQPGDVDDICPAIDQFDISGCLLATFGRAGRVQRHHCADRKRGKDEKPHGRSQMGLEHVEILFGISIGI